MAPLLSIVIANYNYGRFLEEAIVSVVSQNMMGEIELIIVDGKSKDGSVDIIKKYDRYISWWVSESDSGQSEAFNKGFRHATGKYLTWLNADDVIPVGSLGKVIAVLKEHPSCDWFTANHFRFLESTKKVIQVEWGPNWYPRCLQTIHSPLVIFGPSTIFSKRIYEMVGEIDESLHLAMDTDLWIRFIVAGVKQRRINCYCWAFRMHEASKTAEFEGHEREDKSVCSPALAAEHDYSVVRNNYKPSTLTRLLLLLLRCFDGSFVRRTMERRRLMGKIFKPSIGMVR